MGRSSRIGLAALASSALAGPVLAQAVAPDNTVQEIVVTAQKRSENLQDVPIAITALTAETLRNKGVGNLLGLSGIAPGLQIKIDDNAANPRIFIRGVGVNDFNPSTASAVGIYVDGIYVSSPLAQLASFYDLQQVEVLRGPQGTLYGRNTTGGAINVTTKKPTDELSIDGAAEYGRFNSIDLQGGVGGPIVPGKLDARISGLFSKNDGYTLDRTTGQTGNNTNRWALRGALRWTPTETVTDDLTVSVNQSHGGSILAYNRSLQPNTAAATGPDGLCAPGFYTSGQCSNVLGYANTSNNLYQGDYQFLGRDVVKLWSVANTLTWDLGPVSLVSVTGYQHADRNDQEETDANPLPIITASYIARQKTTSQEFRLQSNNKTGLRYVVGAFYSYDDLNNNSQYDILRALRNPTSENPSGADPANSIALFGWPLTQKTRSYAVFSQADYDLTEKLTLTLGLRYAIDDKAFHYFSNAENGAIPLFTFDQSKSFKSLSGRLGLQYKATDDLLLYASYNRGTKSGGFFSGQTTDPADLGPYRDEKVNAYEVGAKTEFFDRRLRANFSAFYYDYKDLQVYTAIQRGALTVQLFTNASAARIYGGEAEFSATPLKGLDLSLGVSLLHAEYRNFVSAGRDYSGNTLPSAPKLSMNGTARYEAPVSFGAVVAQIDFTYRSSIFFDTANTERLSDKNRTFVNGQLGVKLANYEFGIWGRNLFNTTNISDITPIPGLGFDIFSVGIPRTYGLYARVKY